MLSYSILKHVTKETKIFVRYKHPSHHWSVLRKKDHPIDKALNHFDDFYKQVFDKKWPSIRKALFAKKKYIAVVNRFGDNIETISKLESEGALNMRRLFTLEKQYIQEEISEKKRNTALENIFKLDEMTEKATENVDPKVTSDNNLSKSSQFSLASSLSNAQYDTERLVDGKSFLSPEILHHFIPATKIKGNEDFLPESSHYKFYDQNIQFAVKSDNEFDIHFPEHLDIYCYEKYNKSDFGNPSKGSTGVYNYYLMDGGSVLPILALDIKPGHRVLDMCSSPGGKSLLAIQTLYPECVVSNDISGSRLDRVESVYEQFLYDFNEKWLGPGKIKLTLGDARNIVDDNFDRILVDVPCTTDRQSLHENDNNIFKPSRIKERLQLPELQKELLFHALKLVQKGGIVVYSTCSLSPIQNDGVVHMALKQIWEETNMEIVVKDLSPALLQARSVYEFADRNLLKYGHLVLPSMSHNYGPTYFCKLKKLK
ncbi:5-methylcytosine rRNA methyltransferase l(2)10685 [Leptinotarsa decemlineata]|uniref:5-methylcytosine rRNA methyltransferase l(2)10685 n=1 Tax=Leptinotarsa decemlineata TaxID=7539 RepID=UPI003D3077B6